MQAADFFSLPASLAPFAEKFKAAAQPWEWIKQIAPALAAHPFEGALPKVPPGVHLEGFVHIDPSVKLPPYATIVGPVWIGARTEIRPGAYIRGNVVVGEDCVLGNACEFKNCLLMDRVQVPHFSYVGDSILGNDSHLGAGVVCSNLRLDQAEIVLDIAGAAVATGLRKFGAILGEKAEVGCNAVLMPGTLMGRRSIVMPLTPFGGILADGMIARDRPSMSQVPRRD
jgi:UDP-N-acetylglucosamine diphosphorylase / glucose-1-phosphate thymidylyltransferase / UDP-N-acetylgalactosamine diphosphorylase / glucosamine-1-phosphate N-acetyltransferase / galactosamine-1-phosphate N-acetyltransferase